MQTNRRQWLKYMLLGGASFAGGYWLHRSAGSRIEEGLIQGEEWRKAKVRNGEDLEGLRPDESVLAEAKAGIEQHRKGTFSLRLTDAAGEPISDQLIRLQLIDHGVDWGCSGAGSHQLLQSDEREQERSRHFARLFTCTTAKCYWNERWHQPIERYEGIRIYDLFLDEIEWANELGLKVKGHPLVWTVRKALPDWLFRYAYNQQMDILKRHVESLIEVTGERVQLWDLCNEMLWEPAFKNVAHRQWPHLDPIDALADYIAPAVQWARAANPAAVYSLNDYGLLHTYRPEISVTGQRDRYLQLVEALTERDATPDAIGCQTHIGGRFQLDAFQRALDHLALAKLPLQITEFWAKEADFEGVKDPAAREQALAQYVCDMYTVAFGHPQVAHVTYWGGSQLFTESGTPTLLFEQLDQLIHGQWTTRKEVRTDEAGRLSFAGFKGTYQVEIADRPAISAQILLSGGMAAPVLKLE